MNTEKLLNLFDNHAGADRVYLDSVNYLKLNFWLAKNDTKYLALYPSYKGIDIYKVDTQQEHVYFC